MALVSVDVLFRNARECTCEEYDTRKNYCSSRFSCNATHAVKLIDKILLSCYDVNQQMELPDKTPLVCRWRVCNQLASPPLSFRAHKVIKTCLILSLVFPLLLPQHLNATVSCWQEREAWNTQPPPPWRGFSSIESNMATVLDGKAFVVCRNLSRDNFVRLRVVRRDKILREEHLVRRLRWARTKPSRTLVNSLPSASFYKSDDTQLLRVLAVVFIIFAFFFRSCTLVY